MLLPASSCFFPAHGGPEVYIGPVGGEGASRPRITASPLPTGPLEITVREAILLALENNRAFRLDRVSLDITRTRESDARAAFDPVLRAGLSTGRTDTATSNTEHGSGEVSIEASLPSGTTLGLGVDADLTDSSVESDTSSSARVALTVTQSLLRGAGVAVNMATLRQARLDTLASEYDLRGLAEALVADVERTCWEYALAGRRIEIFTESLDLAERTRAETEERFFLFYMA